MSNECFIQTHNQILLDEYVEHGPFILGPYSSYTWRHDPRHLFFTLARYKFCAKMLAGKQNVLEIGCGDAIGSQLMLQTVGNMHCTDLEPLIIEDDIRRHGNSGRLTFEVVDITASKPTGTFDAAFSLDVLEHIPLNADHQYLANICATLTDNAVLLIGTPNVTADVYASPNSRDGHINLKSHDALKHLMEQYFHNVFIFSMNDELVHTGFYPMAHYFFGMGVGRK